MIFFADIDQATIRAVLWLGLFLRAVFFLAFGFDTLVDLDKHENHRCHDYEGNEGFQIYDLWFMISNIKFVDPVFLDDEVVDDKLLAFRRVLTHIVR